MAYAHMAYPADSAHWFTSVRKGIYKFMLGSLWCGNLLTCCLPSPHFEFDPPSKVLYCSQLSLSRRTITSSRNGAVPASQTILSQYVNAVQRWRSCHAVLTTHCMVQLAWSGSYKHYIHCQDDT